MAGQSADSGRLGVAEIEDCEVVFEEIRAVAGQIRQGGVQERHIGGAQLRLDDLERRALELNR
jgi:hypothetical protein